MNHLPDLDAFLRTLRAEGLTVGPREIIWLHHLFQQAPTLERDRFQEMLGCVLAKTPAQRRRFDVLFDLWLGKALGSPAGKTLLTSEETKAAFREKKTAEPEATLKPIDPKTGALWKVSFALWVEVGVLLLLMQFFASFPYSLPEEVNFEIPIVAPTSTDTGKPVVEEKLPDQPTARYWTWVPSIETSASTTSPFWPLLGFGLITLGLAGWLWRRYQHAVRLPEGLPAPAPGPEWLPLLSPESTGPELLNNDDLRNALWSVNRFVSEEYTAKLDLPHTVQATANAGGIPILRHQRAIYDREVWFWLDEQSEHPAMLRLARELQTSLHRAGLTVRIAWFYGLPYELTWEEGYGFDPLVWEGHRGSVIVAILTDGQGLLYAWQSAHRKPRLQQSLYAFGQ